ncbi:hypothetical protein CRYUN_Cryun38cG0019400 [Craigia yunnanensis]
MNKCFDAVERMEGKARNWYEASVVYNIPRRAFVKMMVVDGCFIIELLCKEPKDQIAPMRSSQISRMRWSQIALFCDLLLLENQLPFFVLVKLYGLIKDPTDGTEFAPKAFAKLIQLPLVSRIGTINSSTIKDTNEIDHLLGLVHYNCRPSPQGIDRHKEYMAVRERQSILCARELKEAGIKFTKVDRNQERNEMSLFDVNFTDGKMKIPTFVIDNNTERLFHNLISYELFVQGSTYVIDYVTLMDNLVNTANDVQLLRSCGVIENMLGDDEAVVQMLNKLLDNVTLSGDTFSYKGIFSDVKQHCARPYYILMAIVKHETSRNPWRTIGYVAGLVAAVVTVIQFILSFFTQNKFYYIMD